MNSQKNPNPFWGGEYPINKIEEDYRIVRSDSINTIVTLVSIITTLTLIHFLLITLV